MGEEKLEVLDTWTRYRTAFVTAPQDNVGLELPTDEPLIGLRMVGAEVGTEGTAARACPGSRISSEATIAMAKPRPAIRCRISLLPDPNSSAI
jgi:hypothetical protein